MDEMVLQKIAIPELFDKKHLIPMVMVSCAFTLLWKLILDMNVLHECITLSNCRYPGTTHEKKMDPIGFKLL